VNGKITSYMQSEQKYHRDKELKYFESKRKHKRDKKKRKHKRDKKNSSWRIATLSKYSR